MSDRLDDEYAKAVEDLARSELRGEVTAEELVWLYSNLQWWRDALQRIYEDQMRFIESMARSMESIGKIKKGSDTQRTSQEARERKSALFNRIKSRKRYLECIKARKLTVDNYIYIRNRQAQISDAEGDDNG